MSPETLEMERETEQDKVLRWREETLLSAGYSPEDAGRLAVAAWVDLHVALNLLAQGCKPSVAVEILL